MSDFTDAVERLNEIVEKANRVREPDLSTTPKLMRHVAYRMKAFGLQRDRVLADRLIEAADELEENNQ